MKFKALLLSLMILLPLATFALPSNATIGGPVIWVNPNKIKKWAPCLVSSTFTVDVKLWNKKDLTGVGIYAFDFSLVWLNSTMNFTCGSIKKSFITLQKIEFTAPWDHYFVIANETIKPFQFTTGPDTTNWYTGYHLAITALDNSSALEDVQIVLATLTFHIDCEPLYPDVFFTPLTLSAVLSDIYDPDVGSISPIPGVEIDSGYFMIQSYQPDVHLEPRYWCEYKVGIGHTVEFWISNISKVYGFDFGITFNNTLLEADVQSIKFCDAFPPPYESLTERVQDNGDGTSTLIVAMFRPCEKPTVTHQPGPAATFTLNSIFDANATNFGIKTNSTITLSWAEVYSKCGCTGTGLTRIYYYNSAGDFPLLVYNTTIAYYWRPRLGDLNFDGVVDIQDLQALAKLYGMTTALYQWGNLDGENHVPSVVDIFDFVVVAKYFGKPYICDIADP